MTIDRARFAQEVANRSPLTCSQFEHMLGGEVTDDNKRLAWDIMTLRKPEQYKIFMTWAGVNRYFPDAAVTGTRLVKK